MKKRTVFTIIFVFVAALAAATGFYYLNKNKAEPKPEKFSYDLKDESFFKNAQIIDCKLYKSDIKGVFYTLNPIKYYFVENGKATPIKPSGTLKTTVSDTAFSFNFTIPFINYKGERFGVAVWSKGGSGSIYTYAFALLKKMPKAAGSDYENLVLVDTNKSDKSASERDYSEAFAVSKSGKSGGQLLDTRNRTVDKSGKLRTDWFVYSAESLKHGCYLSGRFYSQNAQNPNYDLCKITSGEDKVLAKKVNSTKLYFFNGAVYYLKQAGKTFNSICYKNGEHKKVASVNAGLGETEIKDNYAFCDMKLINLLNAEITPLNFKKVYDYSPDGSDMLIVGKEENREGEAFKVQKIMYLSHSGSAVLYANNIMSENTSCELVNSSVITEKDGKTHIISLELI